MSINVAINGFGRIGKCCFLQMINDVKYNICAINALNMSIHHIEDYLRYDSVHAAYDKTFSFEIQGENDFCVNGRQIHLFSEPDAAKIEWRKYGCEYLIEATGAYLTSGKCMQHNIDYVIISAPAKDTETNTYVYGVNHRKYAGERVISSASCTTNCVAPMLKCLNDAFGVHRADFTTIHASTSSQSIVDTYKSRSIFNNIIPYSTGASAALIKIMPELSGRVCGTSIRVPVSNGSLVELNVELTGGSGPGLVLADIKESIRCNPLFGDVFAIAHSFCVSSDIITTTTPTILNSLSSMQMTDWSFKLFLWYDNEWSYSAQLLKMMRHMSDANVKTIGCSGMKERFFVENLEMGGKKVMCRCDFNVPIQNGIITDDYRITSTVRTIEAILRQKPLYVVLVAHLGRPKYKENNAAFSLRQLVPVLERCLARDVVFLSDGISNKSLATMANSPTSATTIYLMENVRFHKEETEYENMSNENIMKSPIIEMYGRMGDIFINDAFATSHRKHLSVRAPSLFANKACGYGYVVLDEVSCVSNICSSDKSVLTIVGGNKAADKIPIIDMMKKRSNATIFVAGNLATTFVSTARNVVVMTDGMGGESLEKVPVYIPNIKNTHMKVFDIGRNSLAKLYELIDAHDIIFWNGSLGVIEHDQYKISSVELVHTLSKCRDKQVVIGGGETSSLVDCKKSEHFFVSTGGGALLTYLEQGRLIGLDAFMK